MTLLVDNYDSFSYNLFQLVGSMDPEIKVIRNDAMTIPEIEVLSPDRIILSPGPGGLPTQVSAETLSALLPGKSRSWVSVWDTRSSAKCTGRLSPTQNSLCTENSRMQSSINPALYLRLFRIRSPWPATIPLPQIRRRSRPSCASLPSRRSGRSWLCSTPIIPYSASSSIPNPSSLRTVIPSSGISCRSEQDPDSQALQGPSRPIRSVLLFPACREQLTGTKGIKQ